MKVSTKRSAFGSEPKVIDNAKDLFNGLSEQGKTYMRGLAMYGNQFPEEISTAIKDIRDNNNIDNKSNINRVAILRGLKQLGNRIQDNTELQRINEFFSRPSVKNEYQNNNLWSHLSADIQPPIDSKTMPDIYLDTPVSESIEFERSDGNSNFSGISNEEESSSKKFVRAMESRNHDEQDSNIVGDNDSVSLNGLNKEKEKTVLPKKKSPYIYDEESKDNKRKKTQHSYDEIGF